MTREADSEGRPVWTHRTGDGAFVFTVMTISRTEGRRYITEFWWTGGIVFFLDQRFRRSPADFLKYYGRQVGRTLNDSARVEVVRSH